MHRHALASSAAGAGRQAGHAAVIQVGAVLQASGDALVEFSQARQVPDHARTSDAAAAGKAQVAGGTGLQATVDEVQRVRAGTVRQLCAVTTPEGYKHLYSHFVVEPTKNPALAKQRRLITASMRTNPALPDDYIRTVYLTHTPEEALARVEGQFVNLAGGTVYRHFDRRLHHTPETVGDYPNADLWCGIDFNMEKMSGIVGIVLPDRLLAVDEFVGTKQKPIHDTAHLIQLIKQRYPNRRLHACPDASGENRNTAGWQTNIGLLEAAGFQCHHDRANPSITEIRVPTMNRLLYNVKAERSPRHYINVDRCPLLAEAIEQQPYDDNGKPLIDKVIDHRLDAWGYLGVQTFGSKVMSDAYSVPWQQ